jgi:glycogen debranching enzyme
MKDQGFNISIETFWEEGGFVRGGNRDNCGTWMDKMGDSEKAGIKGVPITPRDGSPIEIAGLQKAAVRWITKDVLAHAVDTWKWQGVSAVNAKGEDFVITYKDWNEKMEEAFEKQYYIPTDPTRFAGYAIDHPELVNRHGIYKDTCSSSLPFTDYQLRPNMCVAMVVAPECFDPAHARHALEIIKTSLTGPLGIKTLDPKDWAYRGVYDNSNDSSDPTVAHGANYHQGPVILIDVRSGFGLWDTSFALTTTSTLKHPGMTRLL